jgi:hypothetical protein
MVQEVAANVAAASEPLLRLIVWVPTAAISTGVEEALQVVAGATAGGTEAGSEAASTISRPESKTSVNVIPVKAPPVIGLVIVILKRLALGYATGLVK